MSIPVVALKFAAVRPPVTVTEAGTDSAALSLMREIVTPPAAGPFRFTEHEAAAFEPRDVGLHETEDTASGC